MNCSRDLKKLAKPWIYKSFFWSLHQFFSYIRSEQFLKQNTNHFFPLISLFSPFSSMDKRDILLFYVQCQILLHFAASTFLQTSPQDKTNYHPKVAFLQVWPPKTQFQPVRKIQIFQIYHSLRRYWMGKVYAFLACCYHTELRLFFHLSKGQLISKCPIGVIVSTKIPTKKFDNFCPRNLKRGQIIR